MASGFAADLREQRKRVGWSRERLAAESGVKLPTIEKIEDGATQKPRRPTMIELAAALERAGVWTISEALKAAGVDEPTSAELAASARDPREEFEALFWSLTLPQRRAIIGVMATMVRPTEDAGDQPGMVTADVDMNHPRRGQASPATNAHED